MILGVAVFFSMAPMDAASAAKVLYLNRNQPWRAGLCELISDYGGAIAYGLSGASLLRYHVSPTTAFVFGCLGTSSLVGTKFGHWLTSRNR